MKFKVYLFIGAAVLVASLALRYTQSRMLKGEVSIGASSVGVEVAKTVSERERGLSGREELAPGRGMLFVFNERARHQFWMKGMLIPIDIIWIDGNKIVDMAPQVPPPKGDEEPRVYTPRAEANFVLEVATGGAALRGWKIGDEVTINY